MHEVSASRRDVDSMSMPLSMTCIIEKCLEKEGQGQKVCQQKGKEKREWRA